MIDTGQTVRVPLFPLHVVLFPGGPLPLRIFETRYIDMVSERMRGDGPFGVVLIRDGVEAGGPAATFETGTLARIADFYQAATVCSASRRSASSAFGCSMPSAPATV